MDIESLYRSAGIQLEQSGTRWKSKCPFHKEEDASFVVFPDGSYHCFGCKAHGTAVDLKNKFDLPNELFPTLSDIKDPLKYKLYEIKKEVEQNLLLLLSGAPQKKRFKAYDMFDRIFMDARGLVAEVDTTLVDVVTFTYTGFEKVKAFVEQS